MLYSRHTLVAGGKPALASRSPRSAPFAPRAALSVSPSLVGAGASHLAAASPSQRPGPLRIAQPCVSALPLLCGASTGTRRMRTMVKAGGNSKVGVLFVCLGNICRSPTAEAMFRAVVERNGVANKFDIDSCGTGGGSPDWYTAGGFSYHEGDDADPRMTVTAAKRGVKLTSRSRPLQPVDLSRFQYIIGMDDNNIRAIQNATEYWKKNGGGVPSEPQAKVALMTDYCRAIQASEVPDPYYGGAEGFERVLDLLDDACEGLLDAIRKERSL
mmetsp:Transcript_18336/g.54705  ORF Transcript_18336/g.54705 Transcript_18336/m.54705 type:complete len:271 (-) Transcript_18336:95-907(-)